MARNYLVIVETIKRSKQNMKKIRVAELKKIINEMEGCTIALDTERLTPLAKRYLSHLENLNAVKCYPWSTERYYIWLYKNIAFECKFFGIARASR